MAWGTSAGEHFLASNPALGTSRILAPLPSGDTTGATDTAALQAILNTLTATNQTPNFAILLAAGTYYLNNSLTINGSRLVVEGAGKGATVIQWATGGANAVPMIEVVNPYSVELRDFDLYGVNVAGHVPSDGIRVHRTGAVTGSEGIHYFRAVRMRIGSGASNNLVNGVQFLNDLANDGNNDFGYLEDLEIILCSQYGVWVNGLNTLAHRFNALTINSCGTAAISNKPSTGAARGGDYQCYGLVTNSNASVFEFFDVQGHIQIFGLRSEGDTHLITTPSTITVVQGQYSLVGGHASVSGATVITFDASDARTVLRLIGVEITATTDTYNFPGICQVDFAYCAVNMSAVTYNGNLKIANSRSFNGGAPVYTNSGSGTLKLFGNSGGLASGVSGTQLTDAAGTVLTLTGGDGASGTTAQISLQAGRTVLGYDGSTATTFIGGTKAVQIKPTALASSNTGLDLIFPAVGAVTAETIGFRQSAQTLTITGGYAAQRFAQFLQPTVTAGSALTVSDAATVSIAGAPIAGGSAILTRKYQLWLQGTDKMRLDTTTQATIGANGAASALTANPVGYLPIYVGTAIQIIPYYNP